MLFLVSPPGHEHHRGELGELISSGRPDVPAIAGLRARYDIEQLTPMKPDR